MAVEGGDKVSMLTNNNPTNTALTKEAFDKEVKQSRETTNIPYQAGPIVLPPHIYNTMIDRGYIKDGKLTKKGIKDLL